MFITVNARYVHATFGLRWLWANLGELRQQAEICEFTLNHGAEEIADEVLAKAPRVVGLGVYVWNVRLLTAVVGLLKSRTPDVTLVIGGPEVSHEYEGTPIFEAADYLIRGEGEIAFARLAESILAGQAPTNKVIEGGVRDMSLLALPYEAYSDHDLKTRLTYVEASRGCPFQCGFCLSSLDAHVREFPLAAFLDELGRLIARGAWRLKFVDRTFNLKTERVEAVLRFLLAHWREGMQVHFEIVPDRISESTLELMSAFPEAGLRLEVGVQTLNVDAQAAILRVQDLDRTEQTLRYLRERTGAVIHADLIAGLPGETLVSFGQGFDRLLALRPHEIQVGILKRLKGTAIAARTDLVFLDFPPYEVVETPWLNADEVARLKRFARYFEMYHNSGRFPQSLPLLWSAGTSAFDTFMGFCDYIWERVGRTHGIALAEQAELLYGYLVKMGMDDQAAAHVVEGDFRRLPGRKDRLNFSQESC